MNFRKLYFSSLVVLLLNGVVLHASEKDLEMSDDDAMPPLFEMFTPNNPWDTFSAEIKDETNLGSATTSKSEGQDNSEEIDSDKDSVTHSGSEGHDDSEEVDEDNNDGSGASGESEGDSGSYEIDEDDDRSSRLYDDLSKFAGFTKSVILDHRSFINFSLGTGFSTLGSFNALYEVVGIPLRWFGGISMVMENATPPQSFLSRAQSRLVLGQLGLDLLSTLTSPIPGSEILATPIQLVQEFTYVILLTSVGMEIFDKYQATYGIKAKQE